MEFEVDRMQYDFFIIPLPLFFRIGHLGDSNEAMMLAAIAIAELSMLDCGIPLQAGSGVAAAGNYYRSHRPTLG